MNDEHAPTAVTENRERHSYARVPERWLLLARVGWGALVALTLAICFASLPVYIAQLQTLCTDPSGATCNLHFTPAQAAALQGIGLSPAASAACLIALTLASVLVSLAVSTLIAWRRSDDRMALLVALALVTFGPIALTYGVATSPSPWQLPNACLYFLALSLLVLVFLLFPSGQFVPRWTRWTLVVFLIGVVPGTFFPTTPFMQNTILAQALYVLLLAEAVLLVVVQFYRYRRVSSPLERQQTKWVVFGFSLPFLIFVSGTVLYMIFPPLSGANSPTGASYQLALNTLSIGLELLIPLSFGFAMLRSRLWDIDVIINRTLVYGALSVILTGVYIGLIIGVQALLRGIIKQDSGVAIVISTLAIAALFQPLRRRIQQSIDRRFYRSKYDAAKTVAAFSATLRQEVDLEQLRRHLLAVVQETMQPAHVSLWLRPLEPASTKQATWSNTPPALQEGEGQ